MSSYRSRGGGGPPGHSSRPYPPPSRSDFYDDRRSSSRSPDRRYSSPPRRYSPSHDISRSPPRGPAADSRYDSHDDRHRNRRQDRGYNRDRAHHTRASPSPRRGREIYQDRDREGYRSPSYDDRSLSPSPRGERPSSRGKPSRELIMEGLAVHLTEDDISAELKQNYHVEGLDDVRVIRDRQTKLSRQFGFLRFASLQESELFMDRNYPSIYLYGNDSTSNSNPEDAKVRISYGRERKDVPRAEDGDWICKNISAISTTTQLESDVSGAKHLEAADDADHGSASTAKVTNVGDNDASPDNTPSQFLLLRGLEPSVTEELLVKGVAKLFKPSGPVTQPNQPAKKGAKVASTTGDANLGAKEGTLRRVLLVRDRRTNDSWRFGFAEYATLEDAQAALTRFNSFDRFTIASKQVLVSYIHAGVFVPVINPAASTERFSFSPLGNRSLKLAYWDDDAYATELVVSSGNPPRKVKSENGHPAAAAHSEGLKSSKEVEKSKKRKAEPANASAKKATPSHLQFWSNRHAELHGLDQKDKKSEDSDAASQPNAPPSQSYADPDRQCCYLCLRQFNSAAEVNKHERLSELHQQNLKNESAIKKAQGKLEKHGIQLQQATIEYRDRARERRKIYGVVNKKGEQVGNGPKAKSSEPDDEEPPAPSKGASLLSKMGYTAGQGLGASGEGRTAPINQDVYAAGVGLGAQGGKLGDALTEAERNTKGDYSGFAERTREGARERYQRLDN